MTRRQKPIELARSLRQQPVPAEALMWKVLRNRALADFKFRRQHPIGPYVADFASVACRIVIELDGESHLDKQYVDAQRTKFLESAGWLVLRYWNTEVYGELEAVKEAIYRACVERSSKP